MGTKINLKLIVLTVIFLFTTILVYSQTQRDSAQSYPALINFLSDIPGYRLIRHKSLSEKAVDMLKLDDYFYADYESPDNHKINLYIGYYYSSSKAYAAHSPLICYPSQGWKIEKKPKIFTLWNDPYRIQYEEIVTSNSDQKELVIYWYQARTKTNIHVYQNKISMGFNKLRFNDSRHGFVRVAVPFLSDNYGKTKKVAITFIQKFYPYLIKFVTAEAVKS